MQVDKAELKALSCEAYDQLLGSRVCLNHRAAVRVLPCEMPHAVRYIVTTCHTNKCGNGDATDVTIVWVLFDDATAGECLRARTKFLYRQNPAVRCRTATPDACMLMWSG